MVKEYSAEERERIQRKLMFCDRCRRIGDVAVGKKRPLDWGRTAGKTYCPRCCDKLASTPSSPATRKEINSEH